MKFMKYVLIFGIVALAYLAYVFIDMLIGSYMGVSMAMAVVGGPFRTLKWGGIPLRPTKDSDAEYELGGFDFEHEASPNGDIYSTGTARIGYVQQECAMTATEFKSFKELQDGATRSGTATCPNGDVLSINGSLDGEQNISGGKVTVKIAGKIKLQ